MTNTDMKEDERPFELTGDHEFSLAEAAEKAGVHRVTLKRMLEEGRIKDYRTGLPFEARWRRLPQPHRVFTQTEIDVVIAGMASEATTKHDVVFEEDKK